MAAFPRGEERHAAPGGVATKRPSGVEMPAPLALAGLAVALAQPSRDGTDQDLHLLDLAALEAGERRATQDFVAEIFGFLASVEQQRLIDRVPHVFAQRLGSRSETFRFRWVADGECIEIIAKARNAERFENPGREDATLGEIADVGQRGGVCRIGQCGCDRVAVPRHQHLREFAKFWRRRSGIAAPGRARGSAR